MCKTTEDLVPNIEISLVALRRISNLLLVKICQQQGSYGLGVTHLKSLGYYTATE